MLVSETSIPGVLLVEPKIFIDQRGFFTEIYGADRYAACGIPQTFVQDNLSRSIKDALRGLHFQHPHAQGKLVTVLTGRILDVVVDVRIGSPTFGKCLALELDDQSRRQLWIPAGLAHGFIVRSDTADVFYKCDEPYNAAVEHVLRWDDEALAIDWGCGAPVLSARDQTGQSLHEFGEALPLFEIG
jgi:dTDP-4-dehydrorhamnose 3,5-epimerase